jgi:cytochrome c oxidase cbb3-type subunit III
VKQLAAFALAAAALLAGCGTHDADAQLEAGRAVYNYRCYFCHGYSGDAKTLATTYLEPKPRDFTQGAPLTAAGILATLKSGREGTAMKSFNGILDAGEMAAVAAFVEHEFVRRKAPNTAYHTAANGWPGHERYAVAYPFATGTIALDTPVEQLGEHQRRGRTLFLEACISCHDRGRVTDDGPAWSSRPLSYPRMGFQPGDYGATKVDAVSSASVYAQHDIVPAIAALTPKQKRGEALFQANCAFCHGADGTGKNWIGQFMEPKARDLTQYTGDSMPPERLRRTIRDGLGGTSMPAWRDVLKPAEVDAVAAYVARAFFRTDEACRARRDDC